MDKVSRYREIVLRALREYAEWAAKPGGPLRAEVVFDPVLDHFEVLLFGWQNNKRLHALVYHLDIIDGKIWVQFDATDKPIAEELVAAGVPKEDIVLGEQSPAARALTGYGVA
jgi:XisI protein